jgi:hypothetical protein
MVARFSSSASFLRPGHHRQRHELNKLNQVFLYKWEVGQRGWTGLGFTRIILALTYSSYGTEINTAVSCMHHIAFKFSMTAATRDPPLCPDGHTAFASLQKVTKGYKRKKGNSTSWQCNNIGLL